MTAARPVLRAATPLSAKLRRAVRGRRRDLERLELWAAESRDHARPLIWVHAPSAGEALMAKAIIGELRAQRPDLQLAFTHFSPSAERLVQELGVDVAGYLPWDTRRPVRAALRALRPTAIAFVRTEVWPVLSREAARLGVSMTLVNAILPSTSSRLNILARLLLEPVYRRLAAVGAVTRDHAERYRAYGLPPGRVRVTGDARFDQVRADVAASGADAWRARHKPDAAGPYHRPSRDASGTEPGTRGGGRSGAGAHRGGPGTGAISAQPLLDRLHDTDTATLVAGSTWPSDERILLPALLSPAGPSLRLILAPHEPTDARCAALEAELDRLGARHARLGPVLEDGGAVPPVVIVDRLGVLAALYALADIAWVGGAFRKQGVHSVVEPAALGVPVLFGPRHQNAREAGELVDAGGGFVVTGEVEARRRLHGLARPGVARAAGAAALEYARAQLGAAARNAALILEHLTESDGSAEAG